MVTKYDVFVRIIEKAPCKPKDLGFGKPVYAHINGLISESWIKKDKNIQ